MTGLLSVFVLAASTLAAPSAPVQRSEGSVQLLFQVESESGEEIMQAYAWVDCKPYPPVSCYGNVAMAVTRNCPQDRGYVTCDGQTSYCPPCGCTEGAIQNVTTGPTCSCEDGLSTPKDRYQCIGGQWEYQFSFCGAPFCPGN